MKVKKNLSIKQKLMYIPAAILTLVLLGALLIGFSIIPMLLFQVLKLLFELVVTALQYIVVYFIFLLPGGIASAKLYDTLFNKKDEDRRPYELLEVGFQLKVTGWLILIYFTLYNLFDPTIWEYFGVEHLFLTDKPGLPKTG